MKLNKQMEQLFYQHSLDPYAAYPPCTAYPIWAKTDPSDRPYWGTGSFWGMDRQPIPPDANLSYLEWDGNEVHLSADRAGDTGALLLQMMGILAGWQKEMAEKHPTTPFYIVASYDDGKGMADTEEGIPSVTMRFWADRSDPTVAEVEHLERYAQPVLVVHCGQ